MKENKDIELIIEKCIFLLEFEFDYLGKKPSEFLKALEKVTNEIKKIIMTDEQYEKLKKEKQENEK